MIQPIAEGVAEFHGSQGALLIGEKFACDHVTDRILSRLRDANLNQGVVALVDLFLDVFQSLDEIVEILRDLICGEVRRFSLRLGALSTL